MEGLSGGVMGSGYGEWLWGVVMGGAMGRGYGKDKGI